MSRFLTNISNLNFYIYYQLGLQTGATDYILCHASRFQENGSIIEPRSYHKYGRVNVEIRLAMHTVKLACGSTQN